MTLCILRTATVLSRNCGADFGRPLTKKVISHSRDGLGVTAPLRTNMNTVFERHCFEEENSLSLTEFYGKLGEFCETLNEFALAHKY